MTRYASRSVASLASVTPVTSSAFALLAAAFSPSTARAVTFNAGGAIGYESMRGEGNNENLAGPGLQGHFLAEVTKLAGATGLLLGANAGYLSVEGDDGNTNTAVRAWSVGPALGLNVPVAQRFSLQVLLGYDFGIAGEVSTKVGQGTKVSRETENFGRFAHEWRGLFDVTNDFGVGFGLDWTAGSTDVADINADFDFRTFGFKGVLNYQF